MQCGKCNANLARDRKRIVLIVPADKEGHREGHPTVVFLDGRRMEVEERTEDSKVTSGIPRLGDPAPDFQAETTMGIMSLEDFRGNWLVFFSHPMDFTPVCTSEFIEFARHYDEFKEMEVSLLGLSIDGLFSHIAWLRNIEEKFGVKIPFPVVADVDARIANLYGMIMPGDLSTATSRCLFLIDPDGIIRASIYYPFTTGRNIKEVLRLVRALKTCDEHAVGTPADWNPGDPVIEYPPRTQDEAEKTVGSVEGCKEWYFCTKQL